MLIQSLPIENDLDQIYFEARCIANALKQDQNTAHALLAIMTCSNPARILLESFNINKDALIQVIKYSAPESNNILLKSKAYAEQSALRFSAKKTNSIHLLHALLYFEDSLAAQALFSLADSKKALQAQVLANLNSTANSILRNSLKFHQVSEFPNSCSGKPRLKRTYTYQIHQDKLTYKKPICILPALEPEFS